MNHSQGLDVGDASKVPFLYLNSMKYARGTSTPDFDRLAFRERLLRNVVNPLRPNATTELKQKTEKYPEAASRS